MFAFDSLNSSEVDIVKLGMLIIEIFSSEPVDMVTITEDERFQSLAAKCKELLS